MANYYVNKKSQENGDHLVHVQGCEYLPDPNDRILLGNFSHCYGSVHEAGRIYSLVDGCHHCCLECHK